MEIAVSEDEMIYSLALCFSDYDPQSLVYECNLVFLPQRVLDDEVHIIIRRVVRYQNPLDHCGVLDDVVAKSVDNSFLVFSRCLSLENQYFGAAAITVFLRRLVLAIVTEFP